MKLDRGEIAENLPQEAVIPGRGFRQTIIRDAESARLFRRQVFETDNGDLAQPQSPCRLHATVASEEIALPIGQNRDIETKRLDAARDLLDLAVAMEPRVSGIKLEPPDSDLLDAKLAHGSPPAVARRRDLAPSRAPVPCPLLFRQ